MINYKETAEGYALYNSCLQLLELGDKLWNIYKLWISVNVDGDVDEREEVFLVLQLFLSAINAW